MSIQNMGLFWEKAEAAGLTQYGILCEQNGLGFTADVPEAKQNEAWTIFHEVEAEEAVAPEPEPKEVPAG